MFVHIPKTAGTSFRASLEKSEIVVCDYGEGKEHTSPVVSEYIYERNDTYGLKEQLSQGDTWLCGHMLLNKYLGIVAPQNIVTFVREPTERVISHFNHEVRWGEASITLEQFLHTNRAQNIQQRFLQGLPLSLIGFVGITEKYSASLTQIESEIGLKVDDTKINENTKKVNEIDDLAKQHLDVIKSNNDLDKALYDSANVIFDQRLALYRKSMPWTYIYAQIENNKTIKGIAYRRNHSCPIALDIYVNNEKKGSVVAKELTTLFPQLAFPRDGFVGFEFNLNSDKQESEQVEINIQDTSQRYNIRENI